MDRYPDHYHLKPYPRQLLEEAAEASKSYIKIYLTGMPYFKRDLAISFEKSFLRIDEDTAAKIKCLIDSGENDSVSDIE